MNSELSFFDLDYSGEYLFIFSDKYNIFVIYFDRDDNKLYLITTDKYFIIEDIDEIETPSELEDYKNIKFFRPYDKNGIYIFNGIVIFKEYAKKFTISNGKFMFTEVTEFQQKDFPFENLTSIGNLDINAYIHKKDKLYLIGYDKEYDDYFFSMIDINQDKIEKLYSIYSDFGDIVPLSMNYDVQERKIYIVGRINLYDSSNNFLGVKPYFESFFA
jgi:hypothetical protein